MSSEGRKTYLEAKIKEQGSPKNMVNQDPVIIRTPSNPLPPTPAQTTSESVRCPKCGSEQITANQKGFGVGKAVVGAAIAGPIGLIGGNIGAKKVNITCLKCGHQWQAGKAK